jgi:hypothetical protein
LLSSVRPVILGHEGEYGDAPEEREYVGQGALHDPEAETMSMSMVIHYPRVA